MDENIGEIDLKGTMNLNISQINWQNLSKSHISRQSELDLSRTEKLLVDSLVTLSPKRQFLQFKSKKSLFLEEEDERYSEYVENQIAQTRISEEQFMMERQADKLKE